MPRSPGEICSPAASSPLGDDDVAAVDHLADGTSPQQAPARSAGVVGAELNRGTAVARLLRSCDALARPLVLVRLRARRANAAERGAAISATTECVEKAIAATRPVIFAQAVQGTDRGVAVANLARMENAKYVGYAAHLEAHSPRTDPRLLPRLSQLGRKRWVGRAMELLAKR
jgi:hypothetical protein